MSIVLKTRQKLEQERGSILIESERTILNGKWESWCKKERFYNINQSHLNHLCQYCFTKEISSSPVISARILALDGPHQDKFWVGILGKLNQLDYV
ncbi:MAG: hypothetical protein ACOWWR_15820 [Eubacteriales bacterium]